MKRHIAIVLLVLLAVVTIAGAEYVSAPEKFVSCENAGGEGFYWLDSTTGRAWLADPDDTAWHYLGQPEGATPGPVGTYEPMKNKDGEGLFILNSATGEGWWTDGETWKRLGVPQPIKEKE